MTYHPKVIAGGKIVIPADVRRELGIKDGDQLVMERDADGRMVLMTFEQVVKDVQAEFRRMLVPHDDRSIVDEFLQERREEARREEADFEEWAARRA